MVATGRKDSGRSLRNVRQPGWLRQVRLEISSFVLGQPVAPRFPSFSATRNQRAMGDQLVLSSGVDFGWRTIQRLPIAPKGWMPRQTAAAQPGTKSSAYCVTALEAERALHFYYDG